MVRKTLNDLEYDYFSKELSGSTGSSRVEKALISVSADPTDTTIDLASGTTGQTVGKVLVSAPGATGDIVVAFYDGVPATTLLAEFYLINMPSNGFAINKGVATGNLGIRISGITNPTKKAYLSIQYGY